MKIENSTQEIYIMTSGTKSISPHPDRTEANGIFHPLKMRMGNGRFVKFMAHHCRMFSVFVYTASTAVWLWIKYAAAEVNYCLCGTASDERRRCGSLCRYSRMRNSVLRKGGSWGFSARNTFDFVTKTKVFGKTMACFLSKGMLQVSLSVEAGGP